MNTALLITIIVVGVILLIAYIVSAMKLYGMASCTTKINGFVRVLIYVYSVPYLLVSPVVLLFQVIGDTIIGLVKRK